MEPEPVRFFFDPICPWAYQTSRWMRRLAWLGVVSLDWGVFSLEVANKGAEESRRKGHSRSAAALRTLLLLREVEGPEPVSRFGAALGRRVHEEGEALDDTTVIADALAEAGVDPHLVEAATADDEVWQRVLEEHTALVDRTRSFGVPTIVLDGGQGPAIFGPVISSVPGDEDAVELWRHVSWLTRCETFSELKRDRVHEPDLESVRARRAERAARDA